MKCFDGSYHYIRWGITSSEEDGKRRGEGRLLYASRLPLAWMFAVTQNVVCKTLRSALLFLDQCKADCVLIYIIRRNLMYIVIIAEYYLLNSGTAFIRVLCHGHTVSVGLHS